MVDTSLAAFFGGMEQAIPHFVGEDGVLQQLAPQLGAVRGARRWEDLLRSGCRTGRELSGMWSTMQQEAREISQYLEEELEGPLALPVQGAGEESMTGVTRKLITTHLEDSRFRVLKRALELHPDQSARPVWAHPQLDKLSQGWVLCLPGPRGLKQAEFSETMARLLCLPSPCCAARVGEQLGERRLRIDPFGDNVLSVGNIPGGSFTARHDLVKQCIHSLCNDAGLRVECEVFGAFRDLIPVRALGEEEELLSGRSRAGLLPDFSLDIPDHEGDAAGHGPLGGVVKTLAELKVIGAVPSYYTRSGPAARANMGVRKRVVTIPW